MNTKLCFAVICLAGVYITSAGCSQSTRSSAPRTWEAVVGGAGHEDGTAIMTLSASEYVVVGWGDTPDSAEGDILLVRLNSEGNLVEDVAVGATSGDLVYGAATWANGDLIVISRGAPATAGDTEFSVTRLNRGFERIWERQLSGGFARFGPQIICADDNAACIATAREVDGSTAAGLVKIDRMGHLVWEHVYVGDGPTWANAITATDDGGYLIVGSIGTVGEQGAYDAWALKVDPDGDSLWAVQYEADARIELSDVVASTGNGVFAVGYEDTFVDDSHIYLMDIDSLGGRRWQKSLTLGTDALGVAVSEAWESGYVVAGSVDATGVGKSSEIVLIKIDNQGNEVWVRTFGRDGDDHPSDIIQSRDQGYCIVGSSSVSIDSLPDMIVLKTDMNGEILE